MPPQGGRKHPHQEFIQIDTTNILFIVGGAFDGIEEIIKRRIGQKVIGFGAEPNTVVEEESYLAKLIPEDLQRFGLIPEFVGRLPVLASLEQLSEDTLYQILTLPKNAIVKQYQKMFELDDVALRFEDDALLEIAKEAITRKTGARGLRSIIENIMLDVMYELPSLEEVTECLITKESVLGQSNPILSTEDGTRVYLDNEKNSA